MRDNGKYHKSDTPQGLPQFPRNTYRRWIERGRREEQAPNGRENGREVQKRDLQDTV